MCGDERGLLSQLTGTGSHRGTDMVEQQHGVHLSLGPPGLEHGKEEAGNPDHDHAVRTNVGLAIACHSTPVSRFKDLRSYRVSPFN